MSAHFIPHILGTRDGWLLYEYNRSKIHHHRFAQQLAWLLLGFVDYDPSFTFSSRMLCWTRYAKISEIKSRIDIFC